MSPHPAASGKLAERPVPRLLQQLFRKRVTGCLVVTDDSGDITRVWVREGFPVHAERPNDIDRLDRILAASGLVPTAAIAKANDEVNRTGRRLGEALVMRGHITREALAEVLKTQIRRKLTRLFFARQGTYEVFTDAHYFGAGDEFELMRIDPRSILYLGIRAGYDDERLRHELAPLAGFSFTLAQVPPTFLAVMGLPANEATTKALRERALMLDDIDLLPAKASESRAVLLALLYGDLLEARPLALADGLPAAGAGDDATTPVVAQPGTARTTFISIPVVPEAPAPVAAPAPPPAAPVPARPPAAAPAAARTTQQGMPAVVLPGRTPQTAMPIASGPPPARGPRPSSEALRSQLMDLSVHLDTLSHFELLGVAENASADEVSAAYMKMMRQLHPDRLAAVGLRELAPVAERVVARMGEAASVLGDPRRRSDHVNQRAGRPTEAAVAAAAVDAEMAFQKAEVYLRKGDYIKAIEGFSDAVKTCPADGHYRSHLAWARFDDPRARKETVAREALAIIEEAVRDRPKFARGHYWIGQIRKFLNAHDDAEKAFREAVRLDPTMLEAEREVRLIEMRRSKATQERASSAGNQRPAVATKQGGRLFGKLFNKDE